MTVQVNQTTITGISAGNYDPKVFTNANFAGTTIAAAKFANATRGCIVKASFFEDATFNISSGGSSGSDVSMLSFTFTRTSNANGIVLFGWTPWGGSNSSHIIGSYLQVGSSRKYDATCFTDSHGLDGKAGITQFNGSWSASELGSGTSHTVTYGRQSRDGSAQTPPQYLNPQNLSARHRENTTNILILEVRDLARVF